MSKICLAYYLVKLYVVYLSYYILFRTYGLEEIMQYATHINILSSTIPRVCYIIHNCIVSRPSSISLIVSYVKHTWF